MRIRLSLRKSIEENAVAYFEAAKKAKRKLEGTKATLARFEHELPATQRAVQALQTRKKEWYEQYRWTFTTDGTLIIAGKDATSNESIIKKHTDAADTVLHTDIPGSPFTILKGPRNDESLAQAAQFCAAYSKAWKAGVASIEVFAVRPEQLSKTPNSGEYISKGSFIVRGEKSYFTVPVAIALGILDNRATAGVPQLFSTKGAAYAVLGPGKEKTSDVAKKLAKKFENQSDEWSALIPAGGCVITAWKKATIHKKAGVEE